MYHIPPRNVLSMYIEENSLNPKQFFQKSNHLKEMSLNPKQFFAKLVCLQEMPLNSNLQEKSLNPNQDLFKIRWNSAKCAKIMNDFTAIYIAAKCVLVGAPQNFTADKKLYNSSAELLIKILAELLSC